MARSISSLLRRGPPSSTLDEAAVYEVLASDRRRWAIEHLDAEGAPIAKRDLADALAYIASDATHMGGVTGNERSSAYVALHQTHLPLLEGNDVVFVDDGDRVIPLAECVALAAIIRAVRERVEG